MTAQIAEKLLYQGEHVSMCTNPLSDYFLMGGFNPRFESMSTALWRGYVGGWEIVDDRLYLVSLKGTLEDGTDATLETVDNKNKVCKQKIKSEKFFGIANNKVRRVLFVS
jgi:hypothetical protein